VPLLEGHDVSEAANDAKDIKMINSDFLNGKTGHEAMPLMISKMEEMGFGEGKINYRLRDAIFSRQRYWGEPFPVAYKGEKPYMLSDEEIPLNLPEVDQYLPTEDGKPPLARANNWVNAAGDRLEYNTMPSWAGSSWYFLRYMDPNNAEAIADPEKIKYWGQVDLYIGGAEHATGHLLYSRFWTKFLHDRGIIGFDEPFKKLVNQGMILGRSSLVYRVNSNPNQYVSAGLIDQYEVTPLQVDVKLVDDNDVLDTDGLRNWREQFKDAEFVLEDGKYKCGNAVEKMSKRWHNVVNPDDVCDKVGADAFRMYEMFLGPLEQYKPWDTQSITGLSGFIRKYWRLFHTDAALDLSDDAPSKAELKTLHQTIKKVSEDIEKLSFNTAVSAFMIATNSLIDLKCNKRAILEPLTILLAPFAPHMCEELWEKLGHTTSITAATMPLPIEAHLQEDSFAYPISFNGKMRFKLEAPATLGKEEVEALVMANEETQKYLDGKTPKRIIVVPKRIVNIVL